MEMIIASSNVDNPRIPPSLGKDLVIYGDCDLLLYRALVSQLTCSQRISSKIALAPYIVSNLCR
jgi:hypothetical protein